jgi:hypothetical protein
MCQAMSGNVIAMSGNVMAMSGNVIAMSGNVMAMSGNVVVMLWQCRAMSGNVAHNCTRTATRGCSNEDNRIVSGRNNRKYGMRIQSGTEFGKSC